MSDPAPSTDIDAHTSDADATNRLVWTITAIAVVVFWLVTTSGRPWDLFDRAGFSSDFYDEQARVFLRGRLAVDPAVPGPEGFVIGDKTYLYYGPFLAIVRMPFMLFGDLFVGRLVRVSMLIAMVVLCRWAYRLSRAARVLVGSPSGSGWPSALFVAAVAFSPALFAAGWVSVYNETELWALTLAVVTTTLTVEWAAGNFCDRRLLALAGTAAMATTLTRAPIGFGVAFVLGVCGLVLLVRSRSAPTLRPTAWMATSAGLLPLIIHAVVNRAKFGSWMSVPGDRQLLSLTNATRAAWFEGNNGSFFSVRFLPTTLAQYWRPDAVRFERLVPGVRFGPLAADYGSYPVESSTPSSSLTTTALLLLVLAAAGCFWLLRNRARTWMLVVAATTIGALPTFFIGFIANRYLMDMLPPLIVAGAVGLWALAATPKKRLLRIGGATLAVWGLWANASLAIWNLELKSPGFTELRHDIDNAVFGGGHDSLITLDPAQSVPRDGVVGLIEDCSGVYIAEQDRWVALERADGIRTVSGVLSQGKATVAAGETWTMTIEPAPVGYLLTFDDIDGSTDFTRQVPGAEGDTYEIVIDEVMGLFTARVGADEFLLVPDALITGGSDIRPDKSSPAPDSALCRSLSQS